MPPRVAPREKGQRPPQSAREVVSTPAHSAGVRQGTYGGLTSTQPALTDSTYPTRLCWRLGERGCAGRKRHPLAFVAASNALSPSNIARRPRPKVPHPQAGPFLCYCTTFFAVAGLAVLGLENSLVSMDRDFADAMLHLALCGPPGRGPQAR